MTPEEIETKVKEHVAVFCVEDLAKIEMLTSFKDELGADSIDVIEMAMLFERIFNIEIPNTEIEKILTVGDMVSTIQRIVTEEQTRIKK